mgnify:CR=1 FL=1
MYIENTVNCGNSQNGQSAAKPGNWKVQRSSLTGVQPSGWKRSAPLWGDDMIWTLGLNPKLSERTVQEIANLSEHNAVKGEQLHGIHSTLKVNNISYLEELTGVKNAGASHSNMCRKHRELLGSQELVISSQALRGRFNDYPKGVQPSGWKRGASHWDDDIVWSLGSNLKQSQDGSELTNLGEHINNI